METQENALELVGISKVFGEFYANKNINWKIKKGTIHGLVGENGAGKTVLMSLLQGILRPTVGTIKVNDRVVSIGSTKKAFNLGIGMVQQHYQLIDIYRVWQNVCLGSELKNWLGIIKRRTMLKQLTDLCVKHNIDINLKAVTKTLSVSGQQKCEILKLLFRDVDILIFDEPTSILSTLEVKELLLRMRGLRDAGKTIIFISHKIFEVMEITDEITTMRLGKIVNTYKTSEVDQKTLKADMFNLKSTKVKTPPKKGLPSKTILNIKDISVRRADKTKAYGLKNFNLQLKTGEIVAVAGISDNGQNELYNAITGQTYPSKGKIVFNNIDITKSSIHYRSKLGMSRVPEDRNHDAIILDYNCVENVVLPSVGFAPFSMRGIMNYDYVEKYTRNIISKYNVHGAARGFATMRWMSGGNQQKVVVGREMERDHSLLIMAQPSRGLDQQSIDFVHEQMFRERSLNKAILFISYDLKEVMEVSDRIIVLSAGKKIFEMETAKATIDDLANRISILNEQQIKEHENAA